LPVSAHNVVQKTSVMLLPVVDVTLGSVHYFYGGRMMCVTGLRNY